MYAKNKIISESHNNPDGFTANTLANISTGM
jgi:hypothetical protein